MANLITVQLRRGEGQPWGFRLQGGKDFSAPLVLQRVNGGSVADQAGLMPGDALVKVNSTDVYNLRHKEAQDVIVAAGNSFELSVSRGTAWRPSVTPTGSIPSPSPSMPGHITPVTKTSLAATPQPAQHIGSGHNQAAKPFPAQQQQQQEQVNGNDPIKSIVNNQYNTPVAMYSDETIAETLSSQAEVLAGGVLGVNFKKNERVYSPANSEVYKMLHEQGDHPEPAHHQQLQQQQQHHQQQQNYHHQQQQHHQQTNTVVTKHVTAPIDKPPSATNGLPAGQNICSSCDRLIVGVFVRIKDKNLHADCFKCATCGTSLKNQGYFNLNGKLYCDIHARLAALQSPPPGTNGMVPVTTLKPGQKSGVQAISAALNAHANLNGRSQSPYAANLHLPPPPPPPPLAAAQSAITTISNSSGGSSTSTQSPSHSRSSSTTSSSGYCNSSSLSPVQSNKVSPLHSRTSSENELHHPAISSTKVPSCYGSDFCFPPPPPPPLLLAGSVPMENPEVVQQQPQPPVEAVDPAAFGPNGLAVAGDPTADSTDSAGAAATNGEVTQNDYGFFYKTMGGAVIRSVFPPGATGSHYKNQNNITPKPFGAAPLPVSPLVQPPSSFPPVAGSVPTPFSAAITGQAPAPAPAPVPVVAAPAPAPLPASYPPAAAPAPVQAPAPAPAPVAAPAAVAPAAPAAVPTPQELFYQKKSPVKQTSPYMPGTATTLLDNSVSKLASINGNSDYRKQASNVLKEMLEARLKKHESAAKPSPIQQDQVRSKNKENLLSNGGDTLPKRLLNPSHPMSRIIDMCDSSVPAPPPLPKTTVPSVQPQKDLKPQYNGANSNGVHVNNVVLRPKHNNNGMDEVLGQLANRRKVSSELTSHARDRRSYVEKNNNNQTIAEESNEADKTTPAEETLQLVNKVPICNKCNHKITTGPFITALGRIWCPDHFICHNANCKRPLADIGFVEEKGDLYCEYCFEEFLAPLCSKCNARVKGDCLNAIGKQFHPECFKCTYCGKLFGNSPFFLEEGDPYCETDWNELFTTKCFACGFPVEAGDKWVEALNNNYHSQCFNCTSCKKNLEGQSFFAKGGRPFCKNHAR